LIRDGGSALWGEDRGFGSNLPGTQQLTTVNLGNSGVGRLGTGKSDFKNLGGKGSISAGGMTLMRVYWLKKQKKAFTVLMGGRFRRMGGKEGNRSITAKRRGYETETYIPFYLKRVVGSFAIVQKEVQ